MNINHIPSETSKIVLRSIIENKKINFKKLKIQKFKKEIETLSAKYQKIFSNSSKKKTNEFKKSIFWDFVKKDLGQVNFKIIKRSQFKKNDKFNLLFSDIGKSLGYNPSLLTILLNINEIKKILKYKPFFEKFQKVTESEHIPLETRISILNLINNRKIEIITPLCPDYEHVYFGMGMYKYTFNKLNSGVGLIGKRILKINNNLHNLLKQFKIKFHHYLYYGDFEGFSDVNCSRLGISEKKFLANLLISCKTMKNKINNKSSVDLLVKKLSSKKDWIKLCKLEEKKIKNAYNKEIFVRKVINEISMSRASLYAKWYPNMDKENYCKLAIQQGAEYSAMSKIFLKKFKNPFVLGLDHPKMSYFYTFNSNISVVYGKPRYV